MRVAVATSSQIAADAAAEVADLGGNAVDCAVAAAMMTMNTQPGVCALAGGGYVTVWREGSAPVTIDGNVAVPGLGDGGKALTTGTPVHLGYGGGVDTAVGAPSVAVPGSLAALEAAWRKFGTARWQQLVMPAVRAARSGFPLPSACHYYLCYSGTPIFGRSRDGFAALHTGGGDLRDSHSTIRVPHLADSLEAIAREGSRVFYHGDIAARIAEHVRAGGGALSMEDLGRYRAIERDSLRVELGGWQIATNPAPAIGGAILAAMLLAFRSQDITHWDSAALEYLVKVQRAVLTFRRDVLDLSDDLPRDVGRLVAEAARDRLLNQSVSAATVHTSAVDDTGLGCAITASSGYGSGEMPAGTGLWLNNCLGELELNRRDPTMLQKGARLPSNMAPTIARRSGSVLAIGTPGADRITTALHQFLVSFLLLELELDAAIAHPRLHLQVGPDSLNVAIEPGLEFLPEPPVTITRFPEIGMYFGGIGAALHDAKQGLRAAADPRREGAVFLSE